MRRSKQSLLRDTLATYRVRRGSFQGVRSFRTRPGEDLGDVDTLRTMLQKSVERLADLQDRLYAHNRHSLLIILQALDAAGKDGAIKHMLSGLNPQGVTVTSFKKPSPVELDHDFLWRHVQALPPRGEIGIFNRSYYEHVLVARVHPELVLNENLPDVTTLSDINNGFWKRRLDVIRRFEQNLVETGTRVVKFYLHISPEEQRKRLVSRIDDPHKNWKFHADDVRERTFWKQYVDAYDAALAATSTKDAPWYVIPADDKWYARLAMAELIYHHMDSLRLTYPTVSKEDKIRLVQARRDLIQDSIEQV